MLLHCEQQATFNSQIGCTVNVLYSTLIMPVFTHVNDVGAFPDVAIVNASPCAISS